MLSRSALGLATRSRAATLVMLLIGLVLPCRLAAEPLPAASIEAVARRLVSAYPDHLARGGGNDLVWHDGTRMALDDGRGPKPFAQWLAEPDLEDMLRIPYLSGPLTVPGIDSDPGRARNEAFFLKMYGDCRKGEVAGKLVQVPWLPRKWGKSIPVTRVNGVAERLQRVSEELDSLPAAFNPFLFPSAGGYNCRSVAGTRQLSAHSFGAAIDIAIARADYWRWVPADAKGTRSYRNRIPVEIVAAFERHGFIWGGRWHHFDTMHFEYRPELLAPDTRSPKR